MPLHIEEVSHRYGEVEALAGISLDIADGETVALIGPSGCGKSTLLGILGGLLEPSAGQVTLSGPPPEDSLNPFTYIFQDFARAVREDREPFVPGEQGRWAIELVNAVVMSHVLGRKVTVPVDRDEYDRVLERLAREPLPKTEIS